METKQCTKCRYVIPLQYFNIESRYNAKYDKVYYNMRSHCSSCQTKKAGHLNAIKTYVKYPTKELNELATKMCIMYSARLGAKKRRQDSNYNVREKQRLNAQRYYRKHSDKCKEQRDKYNADVPDAVIILAFIRKNPTIQREDLTPQFLELKRKLIKLRRNVKQKQTERAASRG